MTWTEEKIQEVAKAIHDKSMADMEFRARFKTDPNAVVEELSGLQLPAEFKINVVDTEDADLTIALPAIETDELSDTELEAVAGGKSKALTVLSDIGTLGIYAVEQRAMADATANDVIHKAADLMHNLLYNHRP